MNFSIECEEEVDGRWIAEVPQLPGVLCYGKTADDAMAKAEVLALRAMKSATPKLELDDREASGLLGEAARKAGGD